MDPGRASYVVPAIIRRTSASGARAGGIVVVVCSIGGGVCSRSPRCSLSLSRLGGLHASCAVLLQGPVPAQPGRLVRPGPRRGALLRPGGRGGTRGGSGAGRGRGALWDDLGACGGLDLDVAQLDVGRMEEGRGELLRTPDERCFAPGAREAPFLEHGGELLLAQLTKLVLPPRAAQPALHPFLLLLGVGTPTPLRTRGAGGAREGGGARPLGLSRGLGAGAGAPAGTAAEAPAHKLLGVELLHLLGVRPHGLGHGHDADVLTGREEVSRLPELNPLADLLQEALGDLSPGALGGGGERGGD
eukprot:Hpha_TRINITY_DN15531_c6_g3::TRINITY_DN15531_c6_g3_i2::g.105489::m.105489